MNLHEHFFMFVSHFYIFFVCELLVHIFSPFSLWVFGLCPSTFKVLYIWVTGSLCLCYIFSKSGSCLLTLFMVFFVMQNFKFLYVVHFINLFLLLPLDLNHSQKAFHYTKVGMFHFLHFDPTPSGVYSCVQRHTKFPYAFESNWTFSSIPLVYLSIHELVPTVLIIKALQYILIYGKITRHSQFSPPHPVFSQLLLNIFHMNFIINCLTP